MCSSGNAKASPFLSFPSLPLLCQPTCPLLPLSPFILFAEAGISILAFWLLLTMFTERGGNVCQRRRIATPKRPALPRPCVRRSQDGVKIVYFVGTHRKILESVNENHFLSAPKSMPQHEREPRVADDEWELLSKQEFDLQTEAKSNNSDAAAATGNGGNLGRAEGCARSPPRRREASVSVHDTTVGDTRTFQASSCESSALGKQSPLPNENDYGTLERRRRASPLTSECTVTRQTPKAECTGTRQSPKEGIDTLKKGITEVKANRLCPSKKIPPLARVTTKIETENSIAKPNKKIPKKTITFQEIFKLRSKD